MVSSEVPCSYCSNSCLNVRYPWQFIGEETSAISGAFELTDAPTWIVDPLDGTTNFVHKLVNALSLIPILECAAACNVSNFFVQH